MANIRCPLKAKPISSHLFSSLSWPSKTLTHWLPSSPGLVRARATDRFSSWEPSRRCFVATLTHWLLLLPQTRDPSCLGFLSFSWPKKIRIPLNGLCFSLSKGRSNVYRNTCHNSTGQGFPMVATKSPVVSHPASGELGNVLAAGIKSYE